MLSVIIPTRNRSDSLKLVLLSLQSQTLPAASFEILIIDNGSTDNTKQIAASFQKQMGNVRYFFAPTPGLHIGRHLGMKMAKADILVYADDDIEAFPTWIDGIEEAFQDENVVLVGGKNLPKFEVEPPGWIKKMWEADKNGNRILGYLSILDLGDAMKIINPNHVFGCNFSIRKATLLDAGGFHPDAMPQELIKYRGDGESHVSRYVKEMGYKALYHPKASVYHLVPHTRLTEEYFCSRAYSQGISDSYTQLRDQHLGSNNTNQTHRFGYQYRRLKKMIMPELCKAAIRKIQRHVFPSNMSPHQKIRDHIAVACRQGWEYHQRAVEKDSTLLLYILRTDYISEDAQHG